MIIERKDKKGFPYFIVKGQAFRFETREIAENHAAVCARIKARGNAAMDAIIAKGTQEEKVAELKRLFYGRN